MNSKILALVVFVVLGAFTLESLAWPASSAPPQGHVSGKCLCCPVVTVAFAPGCNCTVQLQNEVRKFGECQIGNCLPSGSGICNKPLKPCKLIATAAEVFGTGCTGSKSINLVAPCGQGVFDTLQCTNGSTNNHIITLDCGECTCPAQFVCS